MISDYKFSFIVSTRNDNHGGNMYLKNQFFVNRWVHDIKKLDINCELIIVDWNSPKKLRNKLVIPKLNNNQSIKIIEVPNKIHKKFKNNKKLNMFQMIAKNVGARQASGKYLIFTNIDIIFSNNLLKFLKNRELNENCIYRVDRYDINFNKFNNYKGNEKIFDSNITHVNKKYYTHDLINNVKYWTYNSLSGAFINFLKLFFSVIFNFIKYPLELLLQLDKKVTDILKINFLKLITAYLKKIINIPKIIIINLRKIINIPKIIINNLKIIIENISLIINIIKSPKLHTNACGDFQLISKKSFFDLSGYYEYDGYSFHIDSLLMWKAYFMGYNFKELSFKIFHINHTGGYQNSNELFKSLRKKKINYISNAQLIKMIDNLKKNKNYLNNAKFGLVDYKLNSFVFNKY